MLEVEKKVFFKHRAFENFNHRGDSEFAKKGLNNSTSCKRRFSTIITYLMDPFELNFISVFFPVVERLSFFYKSK